MKNIIFQVNIKGRRHRPEFDLSTQSWKKWADKNNCEVLILASKVIVRLLDNNIRTKGAQKNEISDQSYNSWPNKDLHLRMKVNKKKYFKVEDLKFLYRIFKTL